MREGGHFSELRKFLKIGFVLLTAHFSEFLKTSIFRMKFTRAAKTMNFVQNRHLTVTTGRVMLTSTHTPTITEQTQARTLVM